MLRVRDGTIELRKVRGEVNPADLFTKHLLSRERVTNLTQLFGCEFRGGRATSAPQLRKEGGIEVHAVSPEDDDKYSRPCHDPAVLPHHYREGDLDEHFPKATADTERFVETVLEDAAAEEESLKKILAAIDARKVKHQKPQEDKSAAASPSIVPAQKTASARSPARR